MEINVERLTPEERQDLIDQLHAHGLRPAVVDPMRELLNAKNAHIADLQQVISMEGTNVGRFFQLVGLKSGAVQPTAEPKPDADADADIDADANAEPKGDDTPAE